MPIQIPTILLNMMTDPPRHGSMQVNFRCTGPDKNLMDHAAIALGMTQAEYLRLIAVLTSREVIKERNRILGEDAPKDNLGAHIAESEAIAALNPGVPNEQE